MKMIKASDSIRATVRHPKIIPTNAPTDKPSFEWDASESESWSWPDPE